MKDLLIFFVSGFATFLLLAVVLTILGTKSWADNPNDDPDMFR